MANDARPLWQLQPHSRAKHVILDRYLSAWFPILATQSRRLVYFDGFAGPGRYAGGEAGSPLIALNAARKHFARLKGNSLLFVFVEEDPQSAEWLRREVEELHLPAVFDVRILNGRCATVLSEILDELDAKRWAYVPTFALLDPFGLKGLPFQLVARLLQRRSCEALITFMTFAVQRWVTELPDLVNALIGDPMAASSLAEPGNRVETARSLYQKALKRPARFVRFFEMRSQSNQPIYDLFFATGNSLGFRKMKEAMWAVDATGAFKFSDATDPNQTVLFTPEPELNLAPMIHAQFRGLRVPYEEVERFVNEETNYTPAHAKKALQLLETAALGPERQIHVEELKRDGKKRRRPSFVEGTFIRFAPFERSE